MLERDQGISGSKTDRPPDLVLARPDAPPAPSRHAAEWGLASLLLNGFMVILAPLALIEWSTVVSVHAVRWDRSSLMAICVSLTVCEFGVVFLLVVGLIQGVIGLKMAWRQDTPSALPMAGMLTGIVGLVFWTVILISSVITTVSLLRTSSPYYGF